MIVNNIVGTSAASIVASSTLGAGNIQHRATVTVSIHEMGLQEPVSQKLETKEKAWNTLQIINGVRVRHGAHF